jgi:hypothetical protein
MMRTKKILEPYASQPRVGVNYASDCSGIDAPRHAWHTIENVAKKSASSFGCGTYGAANCQPTSRR